MQWMQKETLKKLATAKSHTFTELKPENIESNLFTYHLNQLIADKLILKKDNSYVLTSKGKRFLSSFSLASGKQIRLPRIQTMVFCKNKKNELLLFKWNRQPFLGHVGLPFNRLRLGQSVFTAAQETVKYKTGLEGNLKYLGDIFVIAKKGDEILTHYLVHIFSINKFTGELKADGLTGQPFWGKVEHFEDNLVHGTKEIAKIIKTKKAPFFEEIILEKDIKK